MVKINNFSRLVFSLLICQGFGLIGAFFTSPAIPSWYQNLEKPFFTPPSWLFAPAWITLYILMGIALFLIWKKGLKEEKNEVAFLFFFIQLTLNSLWSILFFGLRSPFWALIEIIILWIFILITILKFFKISKKSGWLMIPYITWVTFAAILNFSIYYLNR